MSERNKSINNKYFIDKLIKFSLIPIRIDKALKFNRTVENDNDTRFRWVIPINLYKFDLKCLYCTPILSFVVMNYC